MTSTMSEKKRKPKAGGDAAEGAEKIMPISYRPSREVFDALTDYRSGHEFPPDKSAVIERAMRYWLRHKGYDLPERPDDQD